MCVFMLVGVCTVRLCVNDRDNEVCLEVKSESLLPELVINKKTSESHHVYIHAEHSSDWETRCVCELLVFLTSVNLFVCCRGMLMLMCGNICV